MILSFIICTLLTYNLYTLHPFYTVCLIYLTNMLHNLTVNIHVSTWPSSIEN